MTAVDFCPPTVKAQVPSMPPAGAEFSCAACSETFASALEQRAHAKSERHVYNTKRKLAGLKPIGQEAWERKLRESRGAGAGPAKGTAHLKSKDKKGSRKGSEDSSTPGDKAASELSFQPPERAEGAETAATEQAEAAATGTPAKEEEPWTPVCCLFDKKRFASIDECMRYSWWHYNFAIPDKEYCTDVPGLLTFLRSKTQDAGICLFCNRRFPDAASCRRHMVDKNHTRIGTEARSRRGLLDKEGCEVLADELEEFYDYHGSTREITDRITDPRQKVGSLLRFADADRDGCLVQKELAALWALATGGEALTDTQYAGACSMTGANPKVGLDQDQLHVLYDNGLADLNVHFAALQDRLTQRLVLKAPRRRKEDKQLELGTCAPIGEGDEEDFKAAKEDKPDAAAEDAEKAAEPAEKAAEDGDEQDEEDSDDSDAESDGTEVYECEDETEFEEVMRVLGLEKATILDNGDLKLPSGGVAVHRDVAHIWKQRGQRFDELVVRGSGKTGPRRSAMMLTNAPANGCKIDLTRRQENREQKKIVAVLRRAQHQEMRLGINQNLLQKKAGNKVRTVFGDASGGR